MNTRHIPISSNDPKEKKRNKIAEAIVKTTPSFENSESLDTSEKETHYHVHYHAHQISDQNQQKTPEQEAIHEYNPEKAHEKNAYIINEAKERASQYITNSKEHEALEKFRAEEKKGNKRKRKIFFLWEFVGNEHKQTLFAI